MAWHGPLQSHGWFECPLDARTCTRTHASTLLATRAHAHARTRAHSTPAPPHLPPAPPTHTRTQACGLPPATWSSTLTWTRGPGGRWSWSTTRSRWGGALEGWGAWRAARPPFGQRAPTGFGFPCILMSWLMPLAALDYTECCPTGWCLLFWRGCGAPTGPDVRIAPGRRRQGSAPW